MIYNINKPIGWTSFDVVKKIRNITKLKKVGHGGTLDPFADGVLIIGVGKGTKLLTDIVNEKKSYNATLFLGEETDSLDNEGEIVKRKPVPIIKTPSAKGSKVPACPTLRSRVIPFIFFTTSKLVQPTGL